jgi:SSS family solute:Na+ symporter
VAYSLDSVSQAWYYLAMLVAGYGFLIVVRWFWWRVNAWSEIAALIGSGVTSTLVSPRFAGWVGYGEVIGGLSFGWRFLIVVAVSTLSWVVVTALTPPSDEDHLAAFCRKVKPFPLFWGPIRAKYPDIEWNPHFLRCVLHWFFGSIAIFALCFGIGNLIFGAVALGVGLLVLGLVIFSVIFVTWRA